MNMGQMHNGSLQDLIVGFRKSISVMGTASSTLREDRKLIQNVVGNLQE
jgi:hypothetical protein